jgi:hypothetical protein
LASLPVALMAFYPFVPVTGQPPTVAVSPVDQPAWCSRVRDSSTVGYVVGMIFLAIPVAGHDNNRHVFPTRSPAMLRTIAVIVALVFLVLPLASAPPCQTKPAKRTTAKSKEAKAAAQLAKARALLGAGKRKEAIQRLRKIVWRYSKTKAVVQALIILGFTPEEDSAPAAGDPHSGKGET